MPRLLTVDLGVTTGFCVRELDGDLVALGVVAYADNMEELFHVLVQKYLPSHVVVEAPVLIARGELQGKLAFLIQEAKKVFRNHTEWVTPAEWKPRFGKTPLPATSMRTTAHEKDAYRIAEWWLKTR